MIFCFKYSTILLYTPLMLVPGCQQVKDDETGDWEQPQDKMGRFQSSLGEVEPFIFNGTVQELMEGFY
ncbi:MAG: hypothetical protein WD431_01465 [Cyclobacteriaceae bacterium]